MQRLLLICRHAETYDPYPLQSDFERELTPEGIRQAHETGKWIREQHQKIDVLVASPAKRASSTAHILASRLYFDQEQITYDPEIYNPREAQLLTSLSNLPDEAQKVLIVSHNPGLTQLARNLSGSNMAYLEPAQVTAITIDLEQWQDIFCTTGILQGHSLQHTV